MSSIIEVKELLKGNDDKKKVLVVILGEKGVFKVIGSMETPSGLFLQIKRIES